jgi:hypothetical protein
MKTNYVLVDYENVKVAHVERLSDERFRVILFLGTQDTKLPLDLVLAMQQLRDRGSYVVLDAHGRNALDFHIAYYLGALATKDPHRLFPHRLERHRLRPARPSHENPGHPVREIGIGR